MSDVENKMHDLRELENKDAPLRCPRGFVLTVSTSAEGTSCFVHAKGGKPCQCRAPAAKVAKPAKKRRPSDPTPPVRAWEIPQESHVGKPTREVLRRSGYRFPESFDALEDAGGDIEKANYAIEERAGPDRRGLRIRLR